MTWRGQTSPREIIVSAQPLKISFGSRSRSPRLAASLRVLLGSADSSSATIYDDEVTRVDVTARFEERNFITGLFRGCEETSEDVSFLYLCYLARAALIYVQHLGNVINDPRLCPRRR